MRRRQGSAVVSCRGGQQGRRRHTPSPLQLEEIDIDDVTTLLSPRDSTATGAGAGAGRGAYVFPAQTTSSTPILQYPPTPTPQHHQRITRNGTSSNNLISVTKNPFKLRARLNNYLVSASPQHDREDENVQGEGGHSDSERVELQLSMASALATNPHPTEQETGKGDVCKVDRVNGDKEDEGNGGKDGVAKDEVLTSIDEREGDRGSVDTVKKLVSENTDLTRTRSTLKKKPSMAGIATVATAASDFMKKRVRTTSKHKSRDGYQLPAVPTHRRSR